MSFENSRATQGRERPRTPEQLEREMRSKMFKGLLAVGAGILSTGWEAMTGGNKKTLWEDLRGQSYETEERFDKKGFFGVAAERTKTVYETLNSVEKILDPRAESTLYDVFDTIAWKSGHQTNTPDQGNAT